MPYPGPAAPREHRPFQGWRIVGVAFLVDFIAVGFFFYSYGVFFKAVAADFGGTRLGVAVGISLTNLVGACLAPFVGRALDRRPIRPLMLAGSACVVAGFAAISQITALWQYYLILATLVALGLSAMGGMASATLVANWFVARRGTAMGIATMGISLSGLIMPPVATWLVAHVGWRGGFGVYAVGTALVVIPVVALFVVSRPEDVGQRPDGGAAPEPLPSLPPVQERTWRTRDILRSSRFWAIALPFSMAFSATSAILTHMVPHATDLGIAPYRAASVLSFTAGAGVAGKLAWGWLVDRGDPRWAVWGSFGTQLAGVAVLAQADQYSLLVASALLFGFGMGGLVPLQGALTGMAFGRLSFGKSMGLLRPVQVPIHAIGIPLAGWIFDATGSYAIAFDVFLGAYVVGILLVAMIRLKRT